MTYTDARSDNLKFVSATRLLESVGVSVPRILAEDEGLKWVWLEDVGREDLFGFREMGWELRRGIYFLALDEVAKLHRLGEGEISAEAAAGLEPSFDEKLYRWEQAYFFEHFVGRCTDLSGEEADALAGEPVFSELVEELSALPRALVHRDFQSENVLVRNGGVYLIDYQGVRFGLPEYDVASLVYDPYVRLTAGEREELVAHYEAGMPFSRRDGFRGRLAKCAAQRLMQALGAYGNLGLNFGKPQYLKHIGPALDGIADCGIGMVDLRGRVIKE